MLIKNNILGFCGKYPPRFEIFRKSWVDIIKISIFAYMGMPRVPWSFISLVYICLCVSLTCYAQDWDEVLYAVVGEASDEVSDEEIAVLEELFSHKCNLNELTEPDCQQFFFLTEFEKRSLLFYVEHNKPLLSVYELQNVLGLPLEKARLLALFCVAEPVKPRKSLSDFLDDGTHLFSVQSTVNAVSNDEYKSENGYQGGANKEIVRYRFQSHNELYVGFTLKKDMGERLTFRDGFDSRSAYIQKKNTGVFSNIVLGDYLLNIGQGLIASQGGFGGSSIEQAGGKQSYVLTKHSSSSEFAYFRGFGATIKLKQIQITPFFSQRKLDGKISDKKDFPFTIQKTGYHRTESECATKQAIDYSVVGTHLQFETQRLRVGFAVLQHRFSKDSVDYAVRNASFMYNYCKRHVRLYGECAFDTHFRFATIHGLQYSLTDGALFSTNVRLYQYEFQSFNASAEGRQSAVENEVGWRSNLKLTLSQNVTLILDNDLFAMPHERTTMRVPTQGDVVRMKLSYVRMSFLSAYYQYSLTTQMQKAETGFEMCRKRKHIAMVSSFPDKAVQFKISAQRSSQGDEVGYLVYEDVIVRVPKRPFSLSVRYAQFDASYDNRLYAWEDNVMYAFSSSQYFYAGTYWYVLLKWKPTSNINLQTKLMQTNYSDKYELPEAYDLYKDNRKLAVHVLVQVSL